MGRRGKERKRRVKSGVIIVYMAEGEGVRKKGVVGVEPPKEDVGRNGAGRQDRVWGLGEKVDDGTGTRSLIYTYKALNCWFSSLSSIAQCVRLHFCTTPLCFC